MKLGPGAKVVSATVLLIGVALILPWFMKPREVSSQNACVASLKFVQFAKTRWAELYNKGPSDVPTEADLFSASNSVRLSEGTAYSPETFTHMPSCPARFAYIIGAVGEETKCSSGSCRHSIHPCP